MPTWDKSALTAGDTVTDWKVVQEDGGNVNLFYIDAVGALQNPVFRFDPTSTGIHQAVLFPGAGVSDQWEVLTRYQYARASTSTIDYGFQLAFYVEDVALASNAQGILRTQIYPDDGLRVRTENPAQTIVNTIAIPGGSDPNRWEWMRSRVDPTATAREVRIRSKVWAGLYEDEPAAWLVDTTVVLDAGVATTGGIGLYGRNVDSDYLIDHLSWDTTGGTAPAPVTITPLTTPTNITASLSGGTLSASWDAVTDATKYTVRIREV